MKKWDIFADSFRNKKISNSLLKSVNKKIDMKYPNILYLAIGATYVLTENIETRLGLVNGAKLILSKIILQSNNKLINLKKQDNGFYNLETQPMYLEMKLIKQNKYLSKIVFQNCEKNFFPL